MSINQPLSTSELAERDRWEQRYGDKSCWKPKCIDLRNPHDVAALFGKKLELSEGDVVIGDEIYSAKELQRAHEQHPQPATHEFKPHHYLVQEAMDDLKKYYAKAGKGPL